MVKPFLKTILLLTLTTVIQAKDYTIGDFKKNYFKIITATKGFYEVKAGFENVVNEIVIGTGFVNNDLYADIITVTKDKKTAKFYIYDDQANKFKLEMVTPALKGSETIVNVKLTQIKANGGYPDIAVITQFKSGNTITTNLTGYAIGKGNSGDYQYGLTAIDGYTFQNQYTTNDKTQEPFNIQIFENNVLVDYWMLESTDGRVIYYYDKSTSTFLKKYFSDILNQTCSGCIALSKIQGNVVPEAYTSAYIDINKDCRSDIVLESVNGKNRYLEFYYYIGNNQFGLINVVTIPAQYSLGTVEDINENNNPDLLFIDKKSGKLVVFLNNYTVPGESSNTYCSDTVSTQFAYPGLGDSPDNSYILTQDLIVNSNIYENADLGVRGFIRLGDIDLDSYKDLTLNLIVGGKQEVYVFLNKPCEQSYATDSGVNASLCRYFDPTAITDDDTSAMKNKNAIQSVYFDLGERG